MKSVGMIPELISLTTGGSGLSSVIELQPSALKAWDDYIRSADSKMQSRVDGKRPFLRLDQAADQRARVQRGEILVASFTELGTDSVANRLIHHWIGAVFIRNATLQGFFSVVHDCDRHKEFYTSVAADSKAFACGEKDQRRSIVWRNRVLFVNAVIQGQYEVHELAVDGRHGYSIVDTRCTREIGHYGRNDKYPLPPGRGSGFIRRLHYIARYEERDGGVYFELEAIALTRNIPAALRWVVNPVMNHCSINSFAASLRETREAVSALRSTGGGAPGAKPDGED